MATLTLHISDLALKRIEVVARNHGHSVEQESAELLESAVVSISSKPRTKEELKALVEELDTFRDSLAAKGMSLTPEDIEAAINEGRE